MIFAGLELMGEIPFEDVIIYSTVLAPDGRRMSKSLGTGIDPMDVIEEHGADATRYGVLKMASAPNVRFSVGAIEEGRRLANKLWNVSPLILTNTEGAEPELRPRDVEERWILARLEGVRAEVEDGLARLRVRACRARSLPRHLRRLLRLVRRGDQAAALRARRRRAGDGARRARAPAQAAPSGDAARDRGDLDAAAGARVAADRGALAGAATPFGPTGDRSSGRSRRRGSYRRSRVRIELSGDAQRIFETVVRPEADGRGRRRAPRSSGCAGRSSAAEKMLSNARFVDEAPRRRGRGRAREARRSTEASSKRSAVELARVALAVARGRSGSGGCARCCASSATRRRGFRSIHVVGSNGKTTTALMTEAILARGGRRASARRSRRTSAAGRSGSDARATSSGARAGAARGRARSGRRSSRWSSRPRFSEFAELEVEAAVVEAGLGGRLDATNVIDAPVVVLTNVSLEHTDVLGPTREAIAAEKLAVVHARRDGRPLRARVGGARRAQERRGSSSPGPSSLALARGRGGRVPRPAGRRRRRRTTCSHPAASSAAATRSGTAPTTRPAIEWLVERLPAAALRRRRLDPPRQGRRRHARLARRPSPSGSIATQSSNPRALPAAELAALAPTPSRSSRIPREALERARELAGPDGAVLVTGSLYLLQDLVRSSRPTYHGETR